MGSPFLASLTFPSEENERSLLLVARVFSTQRALREKFEGLPPSFWLYLPHQVGDVKVKGLLFYSPEVYL